ncbi:MAG TPA: hypothetical protein VKY27_03500 [Bacteriovoracaceae bacterium]|nr:hypothetical protein [Bacteriovoracaceae bacterium]
MGVQVNSLELISDQKLRVGHDYVMRVKIHSLENSVLKGYILYRKDLDDITSH